LSIQFPFPHATFTAWDDPMRSVAAAVPLPDATPDSFVDSTEPVRLERLEIRPDEYGVLVDQRRVHLTVREFQVLWVLARRPDVVIPRPRIYERIWGSRMPYRDRSVDTFVHKVRLKLARVAPDWVFIHTHFGIGYRLAPEEAKPQEPDAGKGRGGRFDRRTQVAEGRPGTWDG
jgi:DNA-binding winged helix-turn-helix (wHTH) protein